jgi:integrase
LPGFGLRISSKGRRSWIAKYRVAGGQQVSETLGTLTAIPSITNARALARASFEQAHQGVHPVAARKQPVVEVEPPMTLSVLIEQFIHRHHERRGSREHTVYEARRLLNRALAYLGDKPVADIGKADILALVNDLADRRINQWRGNSKGGSLTEAAGTLRHLRTCFGFAVAENLVDLDPTVGVRNPLGGRRERERVLSETEIKALWQVCDEVRDYGAILQLLLLTGARKREIGEMRWHELDLEKRLLLLPSTRTKNHHPHDLHLPDLAMEIIDRLPRRPDGDFVFSVTGAQPVRGGSYSFAKTQIDRRLEAILGKVEPWVVHDLRRTAATYMAELGVGHHVVDKILNHQSGAIRGIARVYNRHSYDVEALVYPERAASNVVEMRAR